MSVLPTRPTVCTVLTLLAVLVLAACSAGQSTGEDTPALPSPDAAAPAPSDEATRPPPDARVGPGDCPVASCTEHGLLVWESLPYTPPVPCGDDRTCRLRMDVHAPADPGPWPVVVLVPGGPNPPDAYGYVERAAVPLARKGAVVMSAGWRMGAQWGGGYPDSFRDVACAVRFARALGPTYGGDGDVTLVGHSLGGWAAAVVGLTSTPLAASPDTCRVTGGSPRPDALVLLAGAVDEVRHQGLGADYVEAFLGGTRAERPGAWAAADPYALAGQPAGTGSVPVTVVTGGRDTTITPGAGRALHAALRAAGHPSRYVQAPDADHEGVLDAPAALKAVREATSGS